ncbi:MAG: type III secretion system chaperone [Victivallales bacterium]|nr:type III secretion system chaperone [Victivallales bacterium]
MNDFNHMNDLGETDEMEDYGFRGQFDAVLAEFGDLLKLELVLDDEAAVTFTIDDDIIVNLQYLEESDVVVAFSPVGAFGGIDVASAGEKALALLRLNELGGATEGFTLALDEDADLIMVMDRRGALDISSADSLAAWLESLVHAVHAVRNYFAVNFPVDNEGGRD